MTDAEWNSWQASWTGATGPLPDVRARAQREALMHKFGKAAFFALIAFTLAAALPPMLSAPEPEVPFITVAMLAFFAAMSIGYLLVQRGLGAGKTGTPRDALAFLEGRLRVERLTAHLVRWGYAAMCVAFLFIFPRLVSHHDRPGLEKAITYPAMALTFVVTFSAPWWVARRNRKHQEEIDDWRRWMDEQQL